MKEEFHFLSKDEVTGLRAVRYMPEDGLVRAVLQITHGMQEFIDRYDDFAEYLNSNNIEPYMVWTYWAMVVQLNLRET